MVYYAIWMGFFNLIAYGPVFGRKWPNGRHEELSAYAGTEREQF